MRIDLSRLSSHGQVHLQRNFSFAVRWFCLKGKSSNDDGQFTVTAVVAMIEPLEPVTVTI
jgi:hypothetical protein